MGYLKPRRSDGASMLTLGAPHSQRNSSNGSGTLLHHCHRLVLCMSVQILHHMAPYDPHGRMLVEVQ